MSGPSYSRDREPTREERRDRDLKRIVSRARVDKTKERYAQKYELMAGQDPVEYCTERKLGRSSYFQCRAAYQLGLAREAQAAIKARDQDRADELYAKLKACKPDYSFSRLQKYTKTLAEKKAGVAGAAERLKELETKGPKHRGQARPCRKGLGPLPGNWREVVQDKIPEKYQMAGLISACTGLRPEELSKGVVVRAKDDCVQITINGAKTGQGHGQNERTLTMEITTPLAKRLHEAAAGRQELAVDVPVGAWSAAMRRASNEALGRNLGPYQYRQQFAADLKNTGHSETTIAQAMGHCSERSQSEYGMASQGRGGGGKLRSATASRTPMPASGNHGLGSGPR